LFEAYSLKVFILFLGFNTVNDIQSGEIRDLLKRGIRDNTTKSYKLHLREWDSFLLIEGYVNSDLYEFKETDILNLILLYVVHLYKLKVVVDTYLSALRNLFITERLINSSYLSVFSNDVLMRAKKGAFISRSDLIKDGRTLPVVKPISQDELNILKKDFWFISPNKKNLLFHLYRERIKYLGIMIGVNFGLRSSEISISSNCTKHLALINNNVLFSDNNGNHVLAVDLYKFTDLIVHRVCFKWLDSKVGLQRTEFLSSIHPVENELILHLKEFCIDTKVNAKRDDMFLKVELNTFCVELTRNMLSNTIKTICVSNGLGEVGFSSKSIRVSANSHVKIENDLIFRSRVSLAGMFSKKSTSSKYYVRNTDVVSGGLCLIKENEHIFNSVAIKRNFPN
jgi:hypothetical protein